MMPMRLLPICVLVLFLAAPIANAQQAGLITTVAGSGIAGYGGDGGPAIDAKIYTPFGLAVDAAGNLYIAVSFNHAVRKVTPAGIITTIAGTASPGFSGEGGTATSARLYNPAGIAVDAAGNLFIADSGNNRVRKVAPGGIITTIAGRETAGYCCDGGFAVYGQFTNPNAVALDAAGNLYITDSGNHRIRKITAAATGFGIISTIAGTGTARYSGDGGFATSAQLNSPTAVTVDSAGNVYIADSTNERIRKITPAGIITTVAGDGSTGYGGDGGQATSAQLRSPSGVAVDAKGNLYFSDKNNHRIRKVTPAGIITTVAGTGTQGYGGDGGPPASARLTTPGVLAFDAAGKLYVADVGNDRVRRITLPATPPLINSSLSPLPGLVGETYSQTFTASDGTSPFAWTVAAGFLPPGLSLNPATGVLSGRPTQAGAYRFTVEILDGAGLRDSVVVELTINAGGPSQTPTTTSFGFSSGGGSSIGTRGGNSGTIVTGYATLQISSGSSPAGFEIFSLRQNGILVSEAAVPATTRLRNGRIYAEIAGAVNTGIAIANPNAEPATISYYFTDLNGTNSVQRTFTIAPNGQIAKFLDQHPFNGSAGTRGTFTFSSSVPIAAISLRGLTNERGEFLMTTVPVADLDSTSTQTLVFPHYADGAGWATQFILVNPADTTITGSVQFYGAINIASAAGGISVAREPGIYDYSIPARSSRRLVSAGTAGAIQASFVRVIPAAGTITPAGVAVFALRTGGITVTEAGVLPVPASRAFRVYAETGGNFDSFQAGSTQTGLAIANFSASRATVNFELLTLDGVATGLSGSTTLDANGQTALFLNQISGLELVPPLFQGILRVSTASPDGISIVGLRARYNERQEFLIATTAPTDESVPASAAELVFPHLADAGGFTSEFVLYAGSGTATSSGSLRFMAPSGNGLGISVETQSDRLSAAGITDADGIVTLNVNGTNMTFRFVDQPTGTPMHLLSVGLVIDKKSGHGMLLAIDPANAYPPRFVILEARPASPLSNSVASDGISSRAETATGPIEIGLNKMTDKVIETKTYPIPGQGVIDKIDTVMNAKDFAVLVAKRLNSSGVPLGKFTDKLGTPETREVSTTEALTELLIDTAEGLPVKAFMLWATSGTAPQKAVELLIDVSSLGTDLGTIWGCANLGQPVSVTTFKVRGVETLKLYNCKPRGIDIAEAVPFGANFIEPADPNPCPTSSLELIRVGKLDLAYTADIQNSKATLMVPPGDYKASAPCPKFDPKPVKVTVPPGGTTIDIPLEPPQPNPPPAANPVVSVRLIGPGLTGFLKAGTEIRFTAVPLDATGSVVRAAVCRYLFSNPVGSEVVIIANPNVGIVRIGAGSGAARVWAVCGNPEVSSNSKLISTGNSDPSGGQKVLTVTRAGTGTGTVTSTPAGINCGSTCFLAFTKDSQVTLTAVAATGSVFDGWSGPCTGTGVCMVAVDADKSVTATFTAKRRFTLRASKTGGASNSYIRSNPAAITCPSTCDATFDEGTPVELSVVLLGNDGFTSWGGDCAGQTGNCRLTMTKDMTVSVTLNVAPPLEATIQSATCTGRLVSVNLAGSNSTWEFTVTASGTVSGPVYTNFIAALDTQYVHVFSSSPYTSSWPLSEYGGFGRGPNDPSSATWSRQIVWRSLYVNNETERVTVRVTYRERNYSESRVERVVTCRAE